MMLGILGIKRLFEGLRVQIDFEKIDSKHKVNLILLFFFSVSLEIGGTNLITYFAKNSPPSDWVIVYKRVINLCDKKKDEKDGKVYDTEILWKALKVTLELSLELQQFQNKCEELEESKRQCKNLLATKTRLENELLALRNQEEESGTNSILRPLSESMEHFKYRERKVKFLDENTYHGNQAPVEAQNSVGALSSDENLGETETETDMEIDANPEASNRKRKCSWLKELPPMKKIRTSQDWPTAKRSRILLVKKDSGKFGLKKIHYNKIEGAGLNLQSDPLYHKGENSEDMKNAPHRIKVHGSQTKNNYSLSLKMDAWRKNNRYNGILSCTICPDVINVDHGLERRNGMILMGDQSLPVHISVPFDNSGCIPSIRIENCDAEAVLDYWESEIDAFTRGLRSFNVPNEKVVIWYFSWSHLLKASSVTDYLEQVRNLNRRVSEIITNRMGSRYPVEILPTVIPVNASSLAEWQRFSDLVITLEILRSIDACSTVTGDIWEIFNHTGVDEEGHADANTVQETAPVYVSGYQPPAWTNYGRGAEGYKQQENDSLRRGDARGFISGSRNSQNVKEVIEIGVGKILLGFKERFRGENWDFGLPLSIQETWFSETAYQMRLFVNERLSRFGGAGKLYHPTPRAMVNAVELRWRSIKAATGNEDIPRPPKAEMEARKREEDEKSRKPKQKLDAVIYIGASIFGKSNFQSEGFRVETISLPGLNLTNQESAKKVCGAYMKAKESLSAYWEDDMPNRMIKKVVISVHGNSILPAHKEQGKWAVKEEECTENGYLTMRVQSAPQFLQLLDPILRDAGQEAIVIVSALPRHPSLFSTMQDFLAAYRKHEDDLSNMCRLKNVQFVSSLDAFDIFTEDENYDSKDHRDFKKFLKNDEVHLNYEGTLIYEAFMKHIVQT